MSAACTLGSVLFGSFPANSPFLWLLVQLCQFCVSSVVRHGIQILQIEDRTVLVNQTPYTVHYRPLLTDCSLGSPDQVMLSTASRVSDRRCECEKVPQEVQSSFLFDLMEKCQLCQLW